MLLGIDIGGTTINFGLMDGLDTVKKMCVPSFRHDAPLDETLEYLSDNIYKISTPEVRRIGVGVPTLVDPLNGIVYDAANIPSWKEVHLGDYLSDRFGVPVSVNNDANCFALGAYAMLHRKYDVMVGITLGTGTGVGIVAGDKLVCGANCGAGEICSVPYNGKDYETFCSQKYFLDNGWLSVRQAADAADAGDPEAVSTFREFGRHLGAFLSLVMYAYDPGCIVIGGGVANASRFFQKAMTDSLRDHFIYSNPIDKLEIRFMPGGDAALLGASLL